MMKFNDEQDKPAVTEVVVKPPHKERFNAGAKKEFLAGMD
jgi:hypothetical protein